MPRTAKPAFRHTLNPPATLVDEIAALDPSNPFVTSAYARGRASRGETPVALTITGPEGALDGGTVGYLMGRRLARRLEIPSVPRLSSPDGFWHDVLAFCRSHLVWRLDLQTFASVDAVVPALAGEVSRRSRTEWRWPLDVPPGDRLARRHAQSVAKARKAGVTVRRCSDPEASSLHGALMQASMNRRSDRGEAVPTVSNDQEWAPFIAAGAAEIFQAMHEGRVVASTVILRSADAGYYHLAGNSPEGMSLGAAPLLLLHVAEVLRDEGRSVFNLGGAGDDSAGLQLYKRGFGAEPVHLEAASFELTPALVRTARSAVRAAARAVIPRLRSTRAAGGRPEAVDASGAPERHTVAPTPTSSST